MRKLSPSHSMKTEIHAPGFYEFAAQILFHARYRASTCFILAGGEKSCAFSVCCCSRCRCRSRVRAPRACGAVFALAAGSALPALFPFFVAGELLTASRADEALSRLLASLLRRVYALPQAGASAAVLGLTGGYPVGAAVCSSLLREGRLSASDARRAALRRAGRLRPADRHFCFPWNG